MEDLARLLTLLKRVSDQGMNSGLDMLYKVVVDKESFDVCNGDVEEAREVAYSALETLFDLEQHNDILYGRQKVSMESVREEAMANWTN